MRYSGRKPRPVASSTLAVKVRVNQARSLVGLAVGMGGRFRSGRGIVAPGKATVVEALREEDEISDGVVDGENDLASFC